MRIGQLLAERFVLERLAGRGGMGEVYRAEDRSTGQPVAIKVLHGQHGSDVARFEREARILAELDHPLVVRYVAHGALPTGESYLAMEWLEGEDLAARLGRERLTAADSVALGVRVAEALAALHERGIVHRDLKPSNVFLEDGRLDAIKLLDFGLARTDAVTRITDAGTLLGTVAYMAPEQARGAEGLDARADVFALGCLLFECLTGWTPFAAAHATAILTKILFEDTPRLRQRLSGAPVALDALLSRMLSKQPHERPRDGRAAAETLRALGMPTLTPLAVEETVALARAPAITDSEQRAVAVLLIAAPAPAAPAASDATQTQAPSLRREGMGALGTVAAEHGGRLQWLLDGSAAVLLSSTYVVTDLATQAARCALALRRHTAGRRIALAMGQSELAGRQPVGPTIDRAARLLDVEAAPDLGAQRATILLDDAAMGLLEARFEVRNEGGILVLAGERDVVEARTLLGKPTPCVGRERELRMLEQRFEDCIENRRAQAVLVTASPGVGKSRLGREFVHLVRARSSLAVTWIGRGDSLRAGSTFGLLGQALRGACGVRDGEPLEVRRSKLRAHVAEGVAEDQRQRVTEFLGEIIGTPFPDEDSLQLHAARADAQLMSEQMRDAFLDFLAAECARNPVVILLEDLHWGDRPTVQFLDRALRELADMPLFVLALARPAVHETFPRLWAERQSQEIRLQPLPRKAIERLARHVLEDRASPEIIDTLARLSEGNAFYLEELIRWAAEGREGELPRTVVAMVQSRLAALDDDSRRLLRAASVFGEVFWTGGIAALLGGVERSVVRHRLAELVARELLVERKHSRLPDQDEYTFRHALVREGAYSMLTEGDRVLGHRLAGQWLETHGDSDALMLAEHFEKGGDQERAGRHYSRAVEQAHWASDSAAAITYGQRALACGISGEPRLALLGVLCETHFYLGNIGAVALPYAEELSRTAPGSAPWAQAMPVLLAPAMWGGRMDDFLTRFYELVELASPDLAGPLGLSFSVGIWRLDLLGKIKEADAVMERLGATAYTLADPLSLGSYYWHAISGARAAHAREDPASGLYHRETAIAIARALGHRRYVGFGPILAGMHRWFLGRVETEPSMKNVSMSDEELGFGSSIRPFILSWLLADRGAFDEARDRATRLVEAGQRRRLPIDEGRGHWVLAEVLRRIGEREAAHTEIETALALLGTICPLDVPGALATLAALRLAQGKPAEALAAAEEGLAQYESMGACSFFFRGAFLRLIHAECLATAGSQDAAGSAIRDARQRILTNAAKIQDPDYRQSFLENVPENRRTLELARRWRGEDA